ncbi:MAG TPA: RNA 2',3'-cyclic phosphodiesterase [Ignavibacteriaceae bacterium]|jgi:2'-5' RNA ligase|nr:RNA 2',3'-cyclic phosphodiesterase [Ignavibacteriaceae bacterium]
MSRLFVSLNVPEDVKRRIVQIREAIPESSRFRWESKKKIHLTLKFIGEVSDEVIPQVKEQLKFLKKSNGFNCEAYKFEFFYVKKMPKIVWMRVKVKPAIHPLIEKINDVLAEIGIEKDERPFVPHLTLLRLRGHESPAFLEKVLEQKFEPITFFTDEISVTESTLLPTGSVYREVIKYKLNKGIENDTGQGNET